MKHVAAVLVLFVAVAVWAQSLRQTTAEGQDLPGVTYLGEGAETYNVEPGFNFLVKQRPFIFDFESGPTYTAANNERVWRISNINSAPPALFEDWVELGDRPAGCVVSYIGVDDDPDDRINHFYVGDDIVHTITQGLVFSGSFVLPRDGNLRFRANDSVGAWIEPCLEVLTPTGTATAEPTETPTPSETPLPSDTPTPTEIPTETATLDPSITPTITDTPAPSETPTSTPVAPTPTLTQTVAPSTPESTSTPTKEPRLNSCLRINFDVGGDAARAGVFVVQETGGRILAEWHAEDGWKDSGWIRDIDITFPSVYVVVLYYSSPDADPIVMRILNPAPDSVYGWLTRGSCHALEVAWPDAAESEAVRDTIVVPKEEPTATPSKEPISLGR